MTIREGATKFQDDSRKLEIKRFQHSPTSTTPVSHRHDSSTSTLLVAHCLSTPLPLTPPHL